MWQPIEDKFGDFDVLAMLNIRPLDVKSDNMAVVGAKGDYRGRLNHSFVNIVQEHKMVQSVNLSCH